ncbi:MAG TPA: hypothetical protein VHC48_04035, partial [Puia sp.]|nr:hypothetical protein [Puia sp.]
YMVPAHDKQPAFEVMDLAELSTTCPYFYENVLDDLLGQCTGPEIPKRYLIDPAGILGKDMTKRILITIRE